VKRKRGAGGETKTNKKISHANRYHTRRRTGVQVGGVFGRKPAGKAGFLGKRREVGLGGLGSNESLEGKNLGGATGGEGCRREVKFRDWE